MQPFRICIQAVSVDVQKDVTSGKGYPLIAIHKRVVHKQALQDGCGFFNNVRIIPALRAKEGGFDCAKITDSPGTSIYPMVKACIARISWRVR